MKALDADQQRAVLDGAMQLFTQYDLKDISLDKLSKQTGVAAFDILRQYHSSDNILKAVLERELELMAAAAQSPELRMPGETLSDELQLLAGVILDQYRKRITFLSKMLNEAHAAIPPSGPCFTAPSSSRDVCCSPNSSAFGRSEMNCATRSMSRLPQPCFWPPSPECSSCMRSSAGNQA